MTPAERERFGDVLRCPICAEALSLGDRVVACASGHRFDVARHGFVTLRSGRAAATTGDTADMIVAREAFLRRGHYAPIAETLAELVAERPLATGLATGPATGQVTGPATGQVTGPATGSDPVVLDLAGGTGYYLAHILDRLPGALGVCLDLSAPALRRAARAHPRAIAIGCDVWKPLPIADNVIAVATSVFGPRNLPEIERVLIPGGVLVTVTPDPDHLSELIGPLGMLQVDGQKQERLASALSRFETVASEAVHYRALLDHATIGELVAMGPSAYHLAAETIHERIAVLPRTSDVTVSVRIGVHRLAATSSR